LRSTSAEFIPENAPGTNLFLTLFYVKRRALMEEKTVKDHKGEKRPADTARPGGAAYAPHDQNAEKIAERAGDDRTPDKTIGEIKYAQMPEKKQDKGSTGGAGEPQTSPLEPEKHGGISGP
jgi:hypothetical protein